MNIDIIAYCRSPFKQKFGIPRQAGLLPIKGEIELLPPWNDPACFDGLQDFSHIWLHFIFHQVDHWQCKVRPPRLGGKIKKGIFATRAPVRPNRIGLSVVKLLAIKTEPLRLLVEGIDLLDQTPIIDIRPYIPYTDALPAASQGFTQQDFFSLQARFSPQALADMQKLGIDAEMQKLIRGLIELNPRPAYHEGQREYGLYFDRYNIRWRLLDEKQAEITAISQKPA